MKKIIIDTLVSLLLCSDTTQIKSEVFTIKGYVVRATCIYHTSSGLVFNGSGTTGYSSELNEEILSYLDNKKKPLSKKYFVLMSNTKKK